MNCISLAIPTMGPLAGAMRPSIRLVATAIAATSLVTQAGFCQSRFLSNTHSKGLEAEMARPRASSDELVAELNRLQSQIQAEAQLFSL